MKIGKDKDELTEEKTDDMKTPEEMAEEKLKKWAIDLEINPESKSFRDVIDELLMVVVNDRLNFDKETEVFTYQLLNPMNEKTIITIHETTFQEKKDIQKFKDDETYQKAGKMVSQHTNLKSGEVLNLKTRDQNKITAVMTGFLS